MRASARNSGLTVHAVAGTHVVLLGLDLLADPAQRVPGLAIQRRTTQRTRRTGCAG
jgi:hypothetical protein